MTWYFVKFLNTEPQMNSIIAVFDILNPFLKIGASIIGILSFSVYYYTMRDIDWEETDREIEE